MRLSVFIGSRSGLSRLGLAKAAAGHFVLTFMFVSAKYLQSLHNSRHPVLLTIDSAQYEDATEERLLIDGILLQRCTTRSQSDWQASSSKRKSTGEIALTEEAAIESDSVFSIGKPLHRLGTAGSRTLLLENFSRKVIQVSIVRSFANEVFIVSSASGRLCR